MDHSESENIQAHPKSIEGRAGKLYRVFCSHSRAHSGGAPRHALVVLPPLPMAATVLRRGQMGHRGSGEVWQVVSEERVD